MRLIDADRLTDVVESIDWYHLHNGRMVHGANSDDHQPYYISDDIYEAIRNAPTVDAVPVRHIRHGRWKCISIGMYACSVCGCEPYYAGNINTLRYCPNCGARMDAKRKEYETD